MRKIRLADLAYGALFILILLAACSGLKQNATVPGLWVSADRETYETVSMFMRPLLDDDPSNDPDLSDDLTRSALTKMLDTWEQRLVAAEAVVFPVQDWNQ